MGREYSLVPADVEIAVDTVSISLIRRARLSRASARVMNSGIRSVRSLLSNQFAVAVLSCANVPIASRHEPVAYLHWNYPLSDGVDTEIHPDQRT